jgi:hypothetical protein
MARIQPMALNLLKTFNFDPAAHHSQIMIRLHLFFFLYELISNLHQFLGEYASLDFKLEIFFILLLGDVFLIDVNASINILDTVLVKLIEPKQRFAWRYRSGISNANGGRIRFRSHLLHEGYLLADSPHQLRFQIDAVRRVSFHPLLRQL